MCAANQRSRSAWVLVGASLVVGAGALAQDTQDAPTHAETHRAETHRTEANRAETHRPEAQHTEAPRARAISAREAALMSGRFELAEPRAQALQRVHEAIDRAVAPISFFGRGFAMRRLRDRNRVRDTITTEVSAVAIAVTLGDDRYRSVPGRSEPVLAAGEPLRLEQRVTDHDRFVQTFRAEQGEKETVFVFSPDGSALRLDVTVRSPRLPSPLRYSLSYRRVSPYQAPA
jgi:hypothetical protein